MAGSGFGTNFRITTWGETHGAGVGVVDVYKRQADGSNGHWEKLDLVMTVTGIEKYKNQDGYVAIGSGINGCAYVCLLYTSRCV